MPAAPASTAGARGAQAGISISSSPGCVSERNLVAGNREGFDFREQTRTTPTIEDRTGRPVWNHDELIRHNLIVRNRDAQVWGWFDVKDNRHWPATHSPSNQRAVATAPEPEDIAGAYTAASSEGQPQDLTLEKLGLQFEHNVYSAASDQAWFKWGPTWARHKSYTGLREFQSDLGIDTGSQALDPSFADWLQLDFRLRREGTPLLKENHPRGPVPGVILTDGAEFHHVLP